MHASTSAAAIFAASILLGMSPGSAAHAQTPVPGAVLKDLAMTTRANGTFEVKLTPQAPDDGTTAAGAGRMDIDKQFHGDLEATSRGVMLAARTSIPNSAGYVALERVSGTLGGRTGSFMLQHSGTMNRGTQQLALSVIPDSGTDGLTGLSGTMMIIIAGGTHSYEFDYSFTGPP